MTADALKTDLPEGYTVGIDFAKGPDSTSVVLLCDGKIDLIFSSQMDFANAISLFWRGYNRGFDKALLREPMTLHSDPRAAGSAAYREGKRFGDCPFAPCSDDFMLWADGWHLAKQESERKKGKKGKK